MEKKCSKCKIVKPFDEFNFNKSQKDGRHNYCKKCRVIEKKEYRKAHAEQIKEKQKVYNFFHKKEMKIWKDKNKDKISEYQKKYNRNNPEKQSARIAVRIAVDSGKLQKASTFICCVCNKRQAKQYHHHNGYSPKYRLDVIPVCIECHVIKDTAGKMPL